MHSFQPSRGRIFFEVLCALAMSASFVGAWIQTEAPALLAAAGVAALYAIVRLFDMRRGRPAEAVEPLLVEPTQEQPQVLASDAAEPVAPAKDDPEPVELAVAAEPVEPATSRASKARRTKSPRKNGSRRAAAPEPPKATEPAPPVEATIARLVPREELDAEFAAPAEEHISLAPLFEPEPYVRMPRPAFGRKAR